MFPRTRLIPLLGAALVAGGVPLLLAACGEPPQPLPTSPPYSELPSGLPSESAPPAVTAAPLPTGLVATPGVNGYPTYTPPAATATTTAPTTNSPTPTPAHAGKCTSHPTAAEILALIKGKPGIPNTTLKVVDGPHCASSWSFAAVDVAGKTGDQDPLYVVGLGTGADLALVTAGSDVCNDPVQQQAPASIRVLACGF